MRHHLGHMRRTAAGLRPDLDARLIGLEQASPAWAPWFALWRAAERARAQARTPTVTLPSARDANAPRLHGGTLHVERRAVERLLADLAAAADVKWRDPSAAIPMLEGALRDTPASAAASSDDGAGRTAVLQFAVPVVLSGIGRSIHVQTGSWPHGYCPVCGAWPLRAELRGVERERHLRCGRCGADWTGSWLRCAYCGEQDHERLGLLSSEGHLESRRVETCASCRRYLKAFAVLAPADSLEMLLDDLETVELDLAARERGYARPDGLGYALSVTVQAC